MADKVTRPYNLRSKEDVVEVAVQLQLSDDNNFPVKACSSGQAVSSSKVVSDPTLSDTSFSQQVINMQILSQLQSLERRLDSMEAKNCKKTSDESKVKNKSVKKPKSTETPVTVIPEVKNSLQIPDLNMLRQDALIQLKVEQRLKEIQDADKPGKIKSLCGGSVDVLVKNKV